MALHFSLAQSAACLILLAAPMEPPQRGSGLRWSSSEGETSAVHCVIRLRGEMPALPQVLVDKNVEHCGKTLEDPVLLVRDGRVARAVVWMDCEGGHPESGAGAAGEVQLETRGCLMEPRVQTARVGTQLVLRNRDPVAHNPHGWSGDGRTVFNVTLLDDRLEIKRTLKSPGIHRIDCDTHTWMHAYVLVFDHPWYGTTGEDGEAWIRDVPIGKHRVHVWHEVLGERQAEIEVRAGEVAEFVAELELRDARPRERVPALARPWPPGD